MRYRSLLPILSALLSGGCSIHGEVFDSGTSPFPGFSREVTVFVGSGTSTTPATIVPNPGGVMPIVPDYMYGEVRMPRTPGRTVGFICILCSTEAKKE